MRSLRLVTRFSLLIAALTGLLFYSCHNRPLPGIKNSAQTPNPIPSKAPCPNSTQISSRCTKTNLPNKNSNPVVTQTPTLLKADKILNEGIKQHKKYKYDDALKSFEIASKLYKEDKNLEKEAISLGKIGDVYYDKGNYKAAINYHKKRQIIAGKSKNKKEESAAWSSVGNAYYAMGNYPEARRYYQISLNIAKNLIMDKRAEAIALGGLGSVSHSLGNYKQAIDYHQNRLDTISIILKDNQELTEEYKQELFKLKGAALGSLGNAYHMLERYKEAMEKYEEHLKTARDNIDRRGEGIALGELGSAYHHRWKRNGFRKDDPDLDRAITCYKNRLTIAQEIDDRRLEASTYGGLGYIYHSEKNYREAILVTKFFLKTSRNIEDKPGMGNALNLLGVSYFKLSKINESEQKNQEAKENLNRAIENLKEAIDVRESLRNRLTDAEKVFIFDTLQSPYQNLQQVYINKGEYNLALEVAERGRARAFVDLLSKQLKSDNRVSTVININDIKRISQEQQATLVIYSMIESSIIDHSQPLYIWVVKPNQEKVQFQEVNIKEWNEKWRKNPYLKNVLPDDYTKSIEFVIDSKRTPPGVLLVSFPRISVRNAKKHEVSPEKVITKNTLDKVLEAYHELLIKPNGQNLLSKEAQKVIFVPQGVLFQVPFAALYDSENKKYIIEKHAILTTPSIQTLDIIHKRQQNRDSSINLLQNEDWLIVGIKNAKPKQFCSKELKDMELTELLGAEQEAKDIAGIFQTVVIQDNTEATVRQKMSQARMIHLATHGILDSCKEEGEVPGAIALNASGDDDGWLTASEISQMKLQAELIVLSACDTALGRLTGDGVIGLSRSALAAGSSSAIVSLWNVDDYSTAFLMTEFYRQLKEQSQSGKLDKAEALRQAMLKTKNYVDKKTKKKIYSEPYQWSAFTLVGEATTSGGDKRP